MKKRIIPAIISIIAIIIAIIAINHIIIPDEDIKISEDIIIKDEISIDEGIINHHSHNKQNTDTIIHGITPDQIDIINH